MKIRQFPLPSHGSRNIFGIMVHTTGDGIPKKALREDKEFLDTANEVYKNMRVGPHFCIDPYGAMVQYRPAATVSWHVGMPASHRRSLLNGHWENDRNRIPEHVVDDWKQRYKHSKGPAHLYPSRKPNTDYVGIELIPAGTYKRGSWKFLWGTRHNKSSRFSVEQYISAAALVGHLCTVHSIPCTFGTGRIVGHEDVNPYRRPGWDPGSPIGAFDWNFLEALTTTFKAINYGQLETK